MFQGRVLIHFDGWEMDFDYWTSPGGPYVHPAGWCSGNNKIINPPKVNNTKCHSPESGLIL